MLGPSHQEPQSIHLPCLYGRLHHYRLQSTVPLRIKGIFYTIASIPGGWELYVVCLLLLSAVHAQYNFYYILYSCLTLRTAGSIISTHISPVTCINIMAPDVLTYTFPSLSRKAAHPHSYHSYYLDTDLDLQMQRILIHLH